MAYLSGSLSMVTAQGQPYTSPSPDDVTAKMAQGYTPLRPDGSAYGVISVAGGYLLDGCPINVLMGGALTLAQAQVLVGISSMLQARGWTTCLNQAVSMVQVASGGSSTGTPAGGAPSTGLPVPGTPTGTPGMPGTSLTPVPGSSTIGVDSTGTPTGAAGVGDSSMLLILAGLAALAMLSR